MSISRIPSIGIVGGGPGGLLAAYLLQEKLEHPFRLTILEASTRIGGKIATPQFAMRPFGYEAGAAEFYDYSPFGEDPLKKLIAALGLQTVPITGGAIVTNGRPVANLDDLQEQFGPVARKTYQDFHTWARDQMTPRTFFHAGGPDAHRLPDTQSFENALSRITDRRVQQLTRHWIHSDLAAEPSQTNLDYGLQNYLMNDPAYMHLYGIDGGNEQLMQRLADRIHGNIRLQQRVAAICPDPAGSIRVQLEGGDLDGGDLKYGDDQAFDFVILALPHDALRHIQCTDQVLRQSLDRHLAHFDHPAHYLRITLLFERPFWRQFLPESFCMLEHFGGCCLYDESSRTAECPVGILGWLLGGDVAVEYAGNSDDELIALALSTLPPAIAHGRDLFLEGRVHRWIDAVNAMPGGKTMWSLEQRHRPEPIHYPHLFVVGDYLFDSTLNGVYDSADFVSTCIATDVHH